jgi:two-component system chemotaxis sensor kinase CheA
MISEYRQAFLEELEEQLQLMDDEILKLEQEGDSDQVVQSLFRAAHTLKGSSAAMGFEEMKQLTHKMEHLLDQVRSKVMAVSSPLIDLLFKSLDCLKQLKEDIVREDGSMTDISACVRELESFTGASAGAAASGAVSNTSMKPEMNLDTRLKIQEAQDQGQQVYWITVQISAESVIKGARAYVIHSNMSEWGEILLTSPDLGEIDEQSDAALDITFLYAGTQSAEEMKALALDLSEVVDVKVEPTEEASLVGPANNKATAAQERTGQDEQSPAAKSKQSPTIRVNVERLEHMMNLVGELVIDQTRIHQVERTQSRRFTDESVNDLGQISDHLSRIIGELQESVMKARMLPIEQLFNRFPRMVRDLARDLGKEIELVIEGKDTELDRTLIEEIADPMIHLIRNAVDHGIEMPEKRQQSGKITKAHHQSGARR